MSFSERLKELRISRGLTQKQVYEAVGMSAIGYQRYEYGDREPAYQKLIALADYFDVSLDYLVGRSDFPHMIGALHDMSKYNADFQKRLKDHENKG